MTQPPVAPLCQCGHTREVHNRQNRDAPARGAAGTPAKDGAQNCSRCPSSGIWVDSMAYWVFPCERYQPR
jgi:hypothetical protein